MEAVGSENGRKVLKRTRTTIQCSRDSNLRLKKTLCIVKLRVSEMIQS